MATTLGVDVRKFIEKTKLNKEIVVKKVLFDLDRSLVLKTPVGDPKYWKSPPPKGYVGGRARANWQYGESAINYTTTDAIDKSGSASIARVVGSISEKASGKVHYLTNSLPYIKRLEDGWSRQAPNGMVKLTQLSFQAYVDNAVASL